MEVNRLTEESVDITERLQKIGEAVSKYREAIVSHFKDMEVEVKDWHFTVGKSEENYTIDASVKLLIKPKAKE